MGRQLVDVIDDRDMRPFKTTGDELAAKERFVMMVFFVIAAVTLPQVVKQDDDAFLGIEAERRPVQGHGPSHHVGAAALRASTVFAPVIIRFADLPSGEFADPGGGIIVNGLMAIERGMGDVL